jgi:hypothetical protein
VDNVEVAMGAYLDAVLPMAGGDMRPEPGPGGRPGDVPYISKLDTDGERLIFGVVAIRAKWPVSSAPAPVPSPSSPDTKVLNLLSKLPESLFMLGLDIQEPDSPFGACFNLRMKSSTAPSRTAWWYGDLRV